MRRITPLAAVVALVLGALTTACSGSQDTARAPEPIAAAETPASPEETTVNVEDATPPAPAPKSTELATFGAGCFWCVEAVLEQLEGVVDVRSGYAGGHVDDPTYKQVCSGSTGHAEVVEVEFDPAKIQYEALLEWFWRLHDPTTLNRQGADVGTQYRSAIFVHSAAQRAAAEKAMADAQAAFERPIVTEITDATTFYEAEVGHQDYYRLNGASNGYCQVVITPKLKKLGLE